MPRKVTNKKSKKLPKKKVFTKGSGALPIIPPKLKPCQDCGYKSGTAFSIPFGYADRLGTQRLGQTLPPTININLGDYLQKQNVPIKKQIETQTAKLGEPVEGGLLFRKQPMQSIPYIPLEETISSFEFVPQQKNIQIKPPEMEEVFVFPRRKKPQPITENVSLVINEQPAAAEELQPQLIIRRGRPTGTTEVSKLIELFIQEKGMTRQDATQSAIGYTQVKGGVKDKIKQFEEQIKLQKEGKK